MRMFAQDAAFHRRVRVDETDGPEALRRLKQLEAIDRMRERFTLAEALSALEVGRSTCCERKRRLREEGVKGLVPRSSRPKSHPGRQWTMADAKRVLDVRREMPWAGKARVALELAERRPERAPSEATVGRILRWAVQAGRAKPCDKHAGVQFDHMTTHIDGKTFKEFRAVRPVTRRQCAKACSSAAAHTAKAFLGEAAERLDIRAVQVDGGSEFMAEFEDGCKERGLELLVLPPRSPELNGIVERANRTVRIECWSQCRDNLACAAMNAALGRCLDYCNNRRRHRSLGMKTPAEFATMAAMAA